MCVNIFFSHFLFFNHASNASPQGRLTHLACSSRPRLPCLQKPRQPSQPCFQCQELALACERFRKTPSSPFPSCSWSFVACLMWPGIFLSFLFFFFRAIKLKPVQKPKQLCERHMSLTWASVRSFFRSLFSLCLKKAAQPGQLETTIKIGSATNINVIATTCLTEEKS